MTADAVILDPEDRPAVVESADPERVAIRLPDGTAVHLAPQLVTRLDDGSYRSDVAFDTLATGRESLAEVEERVDVRVQSREVGRVRARTVTESRGVPVEADGWRETVEVERVPIGRPADRVETARTEGAVTIIPVYEEVLVVHKQLVLREEVRLVTRREPVSGPERVTLRRQRVDVERLPPLDPGDGTA